jgi:two-component system chemotaxis response regulator CheY
MENNLEDLKVLIVDDSKTMLRIIGNVINQIGIKKVKSAGDGSQAFELFSDSEFDVILTDWNMPVMDGLTFVKKVRAVNDDIPIVMITTEGGKEQVITALKAGVNNYIVKPFDAKTLKEKLENILYYR